MRRVSFYRDAQGRSPVTRFLDSLASKDAQKVTWTLKLIEEFDSLPASYVKKLTNTDDIWEVRVRLGSNSYRLLCFMNGEDVVILTNGFRKKTQKTPRKEIEIAEARKADWLRRNG